MPPTGGPLPVSTIPNASIRHAGRAGGAYPRAGARAVLGAASVREVDRLNIYHATVLAMQRALARIPARLATSPDHVVVDGKPLRTLGVPHTAVVKGDAKCYAIACASIVAKVTRDRLMTALAERYGHYAWERNAGYGTIQHRSGIVDHGLTVHHRRSFCLNVQTSLALDDVAFTLHAEGSDD